MPRARFMGESQEPGARSQVKDPKREMAAALGSRNLALGTSSLLQFRRHEADELFDLLRFVAVADEDGVGCLHHDEVADAEQSDSARLAGEDDVIRGLQDLHVAVAVIAGVVAGKIL